MAFSPHTNDALPPCSSAADAPPPRPRGVYENRHAMPGCRSFELVGADGRTFGTFCVQAGRADRADFAARLSAALDYYDPPAMLEDDEATAVVLPMTRKAS